MGGTVVTVRPDLVAEFDELFTRLIGLVEREATVDEAIAVLSIIDARRKRVDHIQAFASKKLVPRQYLRPMPEEANHEQR